MARVVCTTSLSSLSYSNTKTHKTYRPRVFKVDYGHGEAMDKFGEDPRSFGVMTEEIMKDPKTNRVCGVRTVQVNEKFEKIEGTDKVWDVDLVILALGFLSPEQNIVDSLGLATDSRGNILAHYQQKGGFRAMSRRHGTEFPGVFAAGDCRRGQSLVVWAINEGRMVADEVDAYLNELITDEDQNNSMGL